MNCNPAKKICDRLVVSTAVTFTDGNLVVNLPAAAYNNGERYCIVVAQNIPDTTTITAPVVFTIGDGTTTYPLLNCNCAPVTACAINRRTRYSVKVNTGIQSGVFSLIGRLPCTSCVNYAASLPIPEATPPTP